jgi:hypothetical protein
VVLLLRRERFLRSRELPSTASLITEASSVTLSESALLACAPVSAMPE